MKDLKLSKYYTFEQFKKDAKRYIKASKQGRLLIQYIPNSSERYWLMVNEYSAKRKALINFNEFMKSLGYNSSNQKVFKIMYESSLTLHMKILTKLQEIGMIKQKTVYDLESSLIM